MSYRVLLSLTPWTVLIVLWQFWNTSSQIINNFLWEICDDPWTSSPVLISNSYILRYLLLVTLLQLKHSWIYSWSAFILLACLSQLLLCFLQPLKQVWTLQSFRTSSQNNSNFQKILPFLVTAHPFLLQLMLCATHNWPYFSSKGIWNYILVNTTIRILFFSQCTNPTLNFFHLNENAAKIFQEIFLKLYKVLF